jgi:hypothetical protein
MERLNKLTEFKRGSRCTAEDYATVNLLAFTMNQDIYIQILTSNLDKS